MLFFSNQKLFGSLILVVSFFNPYTGLGGLAATMIAVLTCYLIGFSNESVKTGLYTYSALLLGLGMGTFFELNAGFWMLLPLAAILSVLLSAALIAKLGKSNLPALSLAFIASLWIVLLASKEFSTIGLTQRNIYWLNEMYAKGGNTLINVIQKIENIRLPEIVSGFLHSLSAILFQSNLAAGIVLTIGLFLYSRIALLLMIAGYAAAMIFINAIGGNAGGINYYNLGTNFMLVAFALGGFYVIPSLRSFLWTLISVPVSYLLVISLGKITYTWGLPVFSLPFCITVILILFCLQLRKNKGKLVLTPIQYYSPEENLYRYTIGKERWMNLYYYPLALPFMGEWMVSQGYDSTMTHKGEWGKALDFVVLDNEMKTFRLPGNLPEHFYCYNKPVLCPADGVVDEIVDHIDDNEIGHNNTQNNWGNTIVIKHADGLYTKLSHLKKNSFTVIKGAYVKKGEVVAHCGNSGRSPEPHLHFQVQSTPYIGSKTIPYPIAYFSLHKDGGDFLQTFSTPAEGSFVSNIITNASLQHAFNFQPGYVLTVQANELEKEEWEVCTTIYNETYFYCKQHNSFAYFINNGTMFYFTNFFGNKKSLLYYFYLASYKVLLSSENKISTTDFFPINIYTKQPARWIQDLIAPFYIFLHLRYHSIVTPDQNTLDSNKVSFSSKLTKETGWYKKEKMNATVMIQNKEVRSFEITYKNRKIKALCNS